MVGLQSTAIKTQLGPLLNGIVDYDFWLPWSSLAIARGELAFLKKYQAKAAAAGVDPLGYYLPPFAYARHAGAAAGGRGHRRASTRTSSPTTCARTRSRRSSAMSKFGADGEWAEARVMEVQFQNVKANDVDQFKDPKTEVILWPPALKTGDVAYPYTPSK